MFLKKIGKKIIFAIRCKKAFFLGDFYRQALLNPIFVNPLVATEYEMSIPKC